MFSLKGTLKVINEEQIISEKFKKREFVLEDNSGQYPQVISFQLAQDKVSLIDGYALGNEVTIYFNLRGREWTSPKDGQVKYFNTLDAWKIEGSAAAAPQSIPQAANLGSSEEDDLPFSSLNNCLVKTNPFGFVFLFDSLITAWKKLNL